jgi:hypothetical protein
VGVQAHALVLARKPSGSHHQVVGHVEGCARRQSDPQHAVPEIRNFSLKTRHGYSNLNIDIPQADRL